jgi:hypothetical protein
MLNRPVSLTYFKGRPNNISVYHNMVFNLISIAGDEDP